MAMHRFWALAPRAGSALASLCERSGLPVLAGPGPLRACTLPVRTFAQGAPGETSPEVPEEVRTPAERLAEGVAAQYGDAAAAAASGERAEAAHIGERAEAAADELEGRAGGTYQAQVEHAATKFEDAMSGAPDADGGGAPAGASARSGGEREHLADAASRVATQVVAGVRDGAAEVVAGVRDRVANVAAGAKRAAGGVGGGPQVGQPGDVDGPPGSGGPAGAQDAGPPHESVEPPFTTRMPSGSRGAGEACSESQTSPFAEGVWQDGGRVYDVHPGGQGADKESPEQLRERARQDAERG